MKTTYYLRKSLFCLLLLASFASISKADYPLFWQRYTADPWGIEYNGRLYLFVHMIPIALKEDTDIL